VGAYYPRAMPGTLTTQEEINIWTTALPPEALRMQRPLADDARRAASTSAADLAPSVSASPLPSALCPSPCAVEFATNPVCSAALQATDL
jgi:hypothetical protein